MRPRELRRQMASWILYDVASSAYILLIAGVAYPLYFRAHVAQGTEWVDAIWGLLLFIAKFTAGLMAPFVGAAADLANRRVRYLALATAISSISTICLAIPFDGILLPAILFCLSFAAYLLASSLYDSLLKSLTPAQSAGNISGLGWGLGYVGGLACYGLCFPFLRAGLGEDGASTYAWSFVVVGVFYGGLGAIALRTLRRQLPSRPGLESLSILRASAQRVARVAQSWRGDSLLPRYVIGANLMSGTISALALFAPVVLAQSFGITAKEVLISSAVFSAVSIPATILSGWLTKRLHAVHVLMWLTPIWLTIIGLLAFGHGWWAAVTVAICVGPTNSLTRGLLSVVAAEREAALTFGMAALVNRLAIAVVPLLFGLISSLSGSPAPAVFVTGIILFAGLLTLPRKASAYSTV